MGSVRTRFPDLILNFPRRLCIPMRRGGWFNGKILVWPSPRRPVVGEGPSFRVAGLPFERANRHILIMVSGVSCFLRKANPGVASKHRCPPPWHHDGLVVELVGCSCSGQGLPCWWMTQGLPRYINFPNGMEVPRWRSVPARLVRSIPCRMWRLIGLNGT